MNPPFQVLDFSLILMLPGNMTHPHFIKRRILLFDQERTHCAVVSLISFWWLWPLFLCSNHIWLSLRYSGIVVDWKWWITKTWFEKTSFLLSVGGVLSAVSGEHFCSGEDLDIGDLVNFFSVIIEIENSEGVVQWLGMLATFLFGLKEVFDHFVARGLVSHWFVLYLQLSLFRLLKLLII